MCLKRREEWAKHRLRASLFKEDGGADETRGRESGRDTLRVALWTKAVITWAGVILIMMLSAA